MLLFVMISSYFLIIKLREYGKVFILIIVYFFMKFINEEGKINGEYVKESKIRGKILNYLLVE